MLDHAAIEARRVPRDDAMFAAHKPGVWQCHYCVKRFTVEAAFMRHHCEEKRRAQEITSPIGQAAYGYYTIWLRLKKFKAQEREAFMASKYYRAFVRFAEMVIAAGISKPDKFIQLMHDANSITPDLWCRDACYKIYLDWMDKQDDPLGQVQSSINCLMDIADKEEIDYRKIIGHLGAQRILGLITQRKLSPWFLLHSGEVQKLLKTLDAESLKNFDRAINIGAWVDRLQEHQKLRKDIREIISELGL